MNSDQQHVMLALSNTLQNDKNLRDQADNYLVQLQKTYPNELLLILSQIILNESQNQVNLIASTYLKNFVQNKYSEMNSELRVKVQEVLFHLFQTVGDFKNKQNISLAVSKTIMIEFPICQILDKMLSYLDDSKVQQIQSLHQNISLVVELLYKVFKECNNAHLSKIHQEYLVNYYNLKFPVIQQILNQMIQNIYEAHQYVKQMQDYNIQICNQIYHKIHFSCLKNILKYIRLETLINFESENIDSNLFLNHMAVLQGFIQDLLQNLIQNPSTLMKSELNEHILIVDLRKILYQYQKICYSLIAEKKITTQNSIKIIDHFTQYYFLNENVLLNNQKIFDFKNLENINNLSVLYSAEVFNQLMTQEESLITQILNTLNEIIEIYGFQAMVTQFSKEQHIIMVQNIPKISQYLGILKSLMNLYYFQCPMGSG